jgi:hypothetical protein
MRATENMTAKFDIYMTGKNALPLSLASLSLFAGESYGSDPLFVLYKYNFLELGRSQEQDPEGYFDGSPVEEYANTLVSDLFLLDSAHVEAEGALVLNVMMSIWGSLYDVLRACDRNDIGTKEDMYGALDMAAALWVGAGQLKNDNQEGYMLYNLAENAGALFGQDQGESLINTLVLESFDFLRQDVDNNRCAAGVDGYVVVREKVKILISFTNTVMVQMLLHYVENAVAAGSDFVELYALAILPQIATCDQKLYVTLVELAVDQDVTAETKDTIIKTIQASFSCLDITCDDVGTYEGGRIPKCDDSIAAGIPYLAEYLPLTDVRRKAQIDRDIREIEILMVEGAYQAAKEYYLYGWNTYFSLSELAQNAYSPGPTPDFDLFKTYYGGNDYDFAHNIIMNVLEGQAPFDNISKQQRGEIVLGILRGVVMYLSTLAELDSAVTECDKNGGSASTLELWDGGAAFFIGSSEGQTPGGQAGGQFAFALAKELCDSFGTCEAEPERNAEINEFVIQALLFGIKNLQLGKCDVVRTVLENSIKPVLLVPLVQGTLLAASLSASLEAGSDSGALGALYAFSRSVLPAIDSANKESAIQISNNSAFDPALTPVPDGIDALFGAFRAALVVMPTDCDEVGELTTDGVKRSACVGNVGPTPTAAPPPSIPTSNTRSPTLSPDSIPVPTGDLVLGFGRYTFTDMTTSENDAKLALDIRDMYLAGSPEEGETIYLQGKNALVWGLSGGLNVKTLSEISTQASSFMGQDPMFNFFRYALYEDASFDDGGDDDGFGFFDALVRLALTPDNGDDAKLASDAAVVTNVWLLITNRLYESVRVCSDGVNAAPLIDSAVALWLGAEQQEGKPEGWMLYSVTELAAKNLGFDEGEAKVNKALMDLFNTAQGIALTCGNGPSNIDRLRQSVREIIRLMSVPLLQLLLYYMSENNVDYVEMFAVALIPQTAGCDLGTFDTLEAALFEGFDRDVTIDYDLLSNFGKSLRCLRMTCDDLGDTRNASDELKSLVATLCTEIEVGYDPKFLAAYETTYDVSELARVDLDIHQIDVLMRTEAYEAAADFYIHGANSLTSSGEVLSLKSLATDPTLSNAGDIFEMYRDYFEGKSHYADEIILSALQPDGDGIFAGASRTQRAEAVSRTLQSMVSLMQIVSKLRFAVSACRAQSSEPRALRVDEAVALFVGSIEGPRSGGSVGMGRMLFSLGKETCQDFNMCETHGDATVNEFLMFAFADLKQWLESNECDKAGNIVEGSVLPSLPISLIQGTLEYAVTNEGLEPASKDGSLATGYILAMAVLPLVHAVNATSAAEILDNMDFNLGRKPVMDGSGAVFDAFGTVLREMGVDCDSIGTLASSGRSLCSNTDAAPLPTTSTNLGDDLYVTTTYVQDRANIALDIKEMENALTSGNEYLAEIIYDKGENSEIYDSSGKKVGLRTLSGFSANSSTYMTDNPLYQVAVFALRDRNGLYLGEVAGKYADIIVREALAIGGESKSSLAAEAAVALNVWMELANELFQTLKNCKDKKIADEDGIHSIDEAAAYWIGDGLIAGDPERGHLLYALAEQMGDIFGISASGQSRTNVNILRLFHQAKLELSFPDSCSESPNTVRRLRNIVNKITTQMIIVNIQALIHNLRVDDRPRVRIYAHAVVPLVAGCNPTTFAYLRDKLIDGSYREVEMESIITAIMKTYPCFGIQCDDIGVHSTESASSCRDPSALRSLAGYRPATDVRRYAQMDYDIQELDILMQMEAYVAAEELYTYGKHAYTEIDGDKTALSLSYLATSSGRSNIPEFDAYMRYYNGDQKYADTIIRGALTDSSLGAAKRRMVVVRGSQYMVMFMATLQAMHESIAVCDTGGQTQAASASQSWDRAAAFIVGHMEGTDERGSGEGRLLWGLAKEQCSIFNTCSSIVEGSAEINDRIVTLLYTGRGAILSSNCQALRKATRELTPLLQIPLIQASLSSTIELGASSAGEFRNFVWAEAYVFSQTLLPLIQDAARESAEIIGTNLDFNGPPLPDGEDAVISAFTKSYGGLGVSCKEVGSSDFFDSCTGSVQRSPGRDNIGLIFGTLIGCLAAVAIVCILRMKRKQKSEPKPVFVEPKGEFNHTSDLLSRRPESVIRPDVETDNLTRKYNDADPADEDDDDRDYSVGDTTGAGPTLQVV